MLRRIRTACTVFACLLGAAAALPGLDVAITRSGTTSVINDANYQAETITVTFSNAVGAVTGFQDGKLLLSPADPTGGSLGPISGSGLVYTALWTPPTDYEGTVSLVVNLNAVSDDAGGNTTGLLVVDVDTLAPAAPTVTSPVAAATVAGSFTVSGTRPTGATKVRVVAGSFNQESSDANWSITVTGLGTTGSQDIDVTAEDAQANVSVVTTVTVAVDATAPGLTIANPTPLPASSATSAFAVDGSTTESDVTVTVTKGAVTVATFTADVSNNWGGNVTLADGVHSLAVTATDAVGNATTQNISVTVDTTPPVATFGSPSSTLVRTGDALTLTVTYSDATTTATPTLSNTDVTVDTLTGDAAAGTVTVNSTADPLVFEIDISGITGDGTMSVSLLAGTATDDLSNAADATGPSATITVDNTAPAIVVSGGVATASPATTADSSIPVTIVFDEATAAAPTLTLNNATVASATSTDGNVTWDIVLTAVAAGSVDITDIAAADPAGNTMLDSTGWPLTTYEVGFGVTVNQAAAQLDATASSPIAFTVSFAQVIDGSTFSAADLVIGGTAGATTAVLATVTANQVYTVSVSGMTGSGTVTLSLPGDRVLDSGLVNNQPATSTDNSVTYNAPSGSGSGSGAGGGGGGGCGAGAGLAGLIAMALALCGLRRRCD